MNASWIARELDVPRGTIVRWLRRGRHGRQPEPPRPVLFPQHGPGRKHERPIKLVGWQRAVTEVRARDLVRGLIHSDGCRYLARQRVGGKTYEYVRYCFSNRSGDVLTIFSDHLDLLGIAWTQPNDHTVAIDRRAEVAKLDAFVGPKR